MAHTLIRDSAFEIALGILRRRKWIGLTAFLAALSLGVPFALFLPDVYRGVATVIVENQDATSGLVRATVPELETRLVTIEQELLSRGRLSDLIVRLNLYPTWRKRASMESIVDRMRRDIRVELSRTDRGRPTTIGLKISYIGLDPRSAAAVPNALAGLYVDENSKMRERQTGQMAEFLKTQLETAREAVLNQEMRLNRFKQQHTGQLPEEVSINMVTLERLNMRLRMNADDQTKIRERQQRLTAGTPARDERLDPLQVLKDRLAELQTKFTDQHPDVIRTKEQIADLERQRAASTTATVQQRDPLAATEAELASLQREEASLRADVGEYERRIQATPQVEQQLEALQRDYNAAKESHASLLKRYEEAQLADRLEQTKQAETFRILDAAIVPTFPAAPNRQRLLVMAFLFAFAAAAGIMLLSEQLDTSFHSVGDLRQFTRVPVLACIPYIPSRITIASVARVCAIVLVVIFGCICLAGFAYRTARENTQMVWMVSAPQI